MAWQAPWISIKMTAMVFSRTILLAVFAFWLLVPLRTDADLVGHGGMVRSTALSPDGRLALTGSFDFSVALWDFEHQREIAVLQEHNGPVTSVRFFAGGAKAATAGDDGVVILWDIDGENSRVARRLTGHGHKVMALAIDPEGRRLASGGWDGSVRLWRLGDGKLLRRIDVGVPVNALAFSGGGDSIVVGGHDPFIRVFAVDTGMPRGKLEGHRMGITDLSVSAEGDRVLSASIDKTVRLWDLRSFALINTFNDHENQVYAVRFLPDAMSFVSAGRDGVIVQRDIATGDVVRAIKAHDKIIWALAVSPDGRFVVSGSSDDTARVWHLASGDRIGTASDDTVEGAPQPWLESSHPGARLYAKCARCHALSASGRRRSGPHLSGLFGRKVGTVMGYNYSQALRGRDFLWNEKTLFELFDKGPDKFLPGTKMPVQRVTDAQALTQLIDYMQLVTKPADMR